MIFDFHNYNFFYKKKSTLFSHINIFRIKENQIKELSHGGAIYGCRKYLLVLGC